MTSQDPYLKGVFPEPPLVAYKRQRNIRDNIIRAQIPANQSRPKRSMPGMKKCGKCVVCPFVKYVFGIKDQHCKLDADKTL